MKTKKNITNLYCIRCDKEVHPLYPEFIDMGFENIMWDNAFVEQITVGYGSKNDGNSYLIAVCDDCMNKLQEVDNINTFDFLIKEDDDEA
jgi:hypothetical protein